MFPEQDINRHNYQLRFMEMENKIKKCELERAELEQRFSQLMRERQECEKAAARQLKMKYKRMMELERQRADRNESLLRMLHKIDQQATSLAAKTDRLKMLKTQYESYLIRSWSSQRALPPCSPVPSMHSPQPQFFTAPQQTTSFQFPHRASDSPKSEFVRYLSDMTHAQTVSYSPIPPPTALSNYINHQQLPMHQQFTPNFLAPTPTFTQDPFLRPPPRDIPSSLNITTLNPPTEPSIIPATPRRSPSTIPPSAAKKFDLSNEEFIQYIDNEILKGSTSTASAVAGSIPPPDIVIEPPTIASTPLPVAYLEDITNDVDEDLLQPPPGTSRFLDDSPIIEEIVEATGDLELTDDSSSPLNEIPSLEVSDEAVINQRWEKVVEVNSTVRPPSAVPPQESTEEPQIRPPPLQDVIARTLRGVISEVEERREAPAVSDDSETVDRELPKAEDAPHSSEKDELTSTSAAFGEMQPEYPQLNYDQEVDYQQEHYLPPDDPYPPTTQDYQEAPPPEYAAQEPADYAYDYSSADVEQPNETHWPTARQAVRSKSHVTTPETIEEVVSNGEASPQEKRSPPSGSKRTSPTGENLSATEIHAEVPIDPEPEQPPPEDPQQYDYSQYQPEYDPNVDYQQQDGADQQAYYQQQYAADDQSGQQDPSQVQPYQEYADVDPNQYQQATEYPGPTQYVFEQGYYDEPSQEQQSEQQQQQQGYYEDPNAAEQQYYGEEQQSDQAYYDQSQEQQEYANYEPTAVEGQEQGVAEVAPQAVQEEVKGEEDEQVEQVDPSSTLMSSGSVAGVESMEQKVEEKASESVTEGNSESPVKLEVTGKEDTTMSSANDESDFDFSTQ